MYACFFLKLKTDSKMHMNNVPRKFLGKRTPKRKLSLLDIDML